MKILTRTLLGTAIAALLVSPVGAAGSLPVVKPPLLPTKGSAIELDQPTNRLIVKFRDAGLSAAARDSALSRVAASHDLQAKASHRLAVGADVVRLSRKLDRVEVETFLSALRADPTVEYAIVDKLMKPMYTPNDPLYATNQWHYFDPIGGVRLPQAWNFSKGSGAVVAVLDTGITAHPDLDANVLPGYDFILDVTTAGDGDGRDADAADPGDFTDGSEGCGTGNSSWHGTHVAGTVAAVTNNGVGVAGVAPQAKVVPVRVLGKCGGYTSDIADAIVWSSGGTVPGVPANPNPAEVINMSLGGGGACDPVSQAAIDGAVGRGTVVVVAAGNSNATVADFNPASCNNVVSVASNDQTGVRSSFSNAGTLIDVSAGGGAPGVASTLNAGTTVPAAPSYAGYQGTSMASPHVAGVVALMQSASPKTPAEVERLLTLTARKMSGAACPGLCGTGIVDALKAVNAATGAINVIPRPINLNNGVTRTLSGGAASIQRFTLTTRPDVTNLQFALSGGTGNADLYVKLGAPPSVAVNDCASISGTSTELCELPAAANGIWHVMVKGKTAFSGVTLNGSYDSIDFFNLDDVPVLDNNPSTPVYSDVYVHDTAGNAPANMRVTVRVYHTWIGDLVIDLIAPDGTVYPLHNRAGGSADIIDQNFFVDASSETANGTWRLRARDEGGADTGHIDQWFLRF